MRRQGFTFNTRFVPPILIFLLILLVLFIIPPINIFFITGLLVLISLFVFYTTRVFVKRVSLSVILSLVTFTLLFLQIAGVLDTLNLILLCALALGLLILFDIIQ